MGSLPHLHSDWPDFYDATAPCHGVLLILEHTQEAPSPLGERALRRALPPAALRPRSRGPRSRALSAAPHSACATARLAVSAAQFPSPHHCSHGRRPPGAGLLRLRARRRVPRAVACLWPVGGEMRLGLGFWGRLAFVWATIALGRRIRSDDQR
ncbi:hypothetical protein GUJ93_ZPchr0002g26568 [Zizania palustris]|uniref:Uncharacterized protein n=1 Tax=Zizania palustris TaxID=103762 RepID=A0A8J5S1H6_ZIZPA|nr:hypothetical protein GUJ93_ZPchr0002g26568 [Zizania palustris]